MDTRHDPSRELEEVNRRLADIQEQLAYLVERQKKTEELFSEMSPILREVMASATTRLDALEKKGYFAFGRELVGVGERVMAGFTPDDVRQLGDAIVGILDTVREATQPEVLHVASDAARVLQNADRAAPIGLLGMVRASGDHEVQKGMSVMVEVMRHVGRAAAVASAKRKGARVPEPRAPRKILGVERPAVVRSEAAAAAGPACAVPRPPAAPAAVIDGVAFSADGHLVDAASWTAELGAKIAAMQSVPMTEAHWKVVQAARADFESTKASPNVRRLTQISGLATKDLYALFPKAPARTIAKIAGLPKPAGCL